MGERCVHVCMGERCVHVHVVGEACVCKCGGRCVHVCVVGEVCACACVCVRGMCMCVWWERCVHVRVVGRSVLCVHACVHVCLYKCSRVHAHLMHMVAVSHRVLVRVYVCVDPCVQCNEWSIDYVCMYSVCTCV